MQDRFTLHLEYFTSNHITIPLKLRLSFDSRSIQAGVLIIRCQISSISQANMVSRRGEEGG